MSHIICQQSALDHYSLNVDWKLGSVSDIHHQVRNTADVVEILLRTPPDPRCRWAQLFFFLS